jgi:parallel beta-helix repeat protein
VVIDLNGFSFGDGAVGLEGIRKENSGQLVVRNGTLYGWWQAITATSSDAQLVLEDLKFYSLNSTAVQTPGSAHMSHCDVFQGLSNAAPAIQVGPNSLVEETSVTGTVFNTGISVGDSSTVRNCQVSSTSGTGILAKDRCVIVGNHLVGNAGVGIQAASDSRVEGNHLERNKVGIQLTGSRTVATHNTAICNTSSNYSVGTGNDVGPIGKAATATSPWANLSLSNGC